MKVKDYYAAEAEKETPVLEEDEHVEMLADYFGVPLHEIDEEVFSIRTEE